MLIYSTEAALDKNTTSTTDTPTRVLEPTGSIREPEDLIKAYNAEAGTSAVPASTATGITDKAGVTDKVWKPTDVDAVAPSVTDPTAAPETGAGAGADASGKDTLWRGVDSYKDGPTSTGSTVTGSEQTRRPTGEPTTDGPKGAIDAEPKSYSVGDLTTGKETPAKSVDDSTTSINAASQSDPKTGESAASPPDLSTTSPGDKPDYTADTHKPSPNSGGTWAHKVGDVLNKADGIAGLVGERAGHGGPSTGVEEDKKAAEKLSAEHKKSSSISPSGDDDEKSGKMHQLKDKLKNKLHIGKDH